MRGPCGTGRWLQALPLDTRLPGRMRTPSVFSCLPFKHQIYSVSESILPVPNNADRDCQQLMYLEGLSPPRHLTSGPTHTRPSTHSPLGTVGFARCLIRVYSSRSLWEQMLFLRGNKPYYRDTCEYQEPQAAKHTHTHTRTHAHAHVHANTCTQIFVSCSVDQLNVGSKG